MEQNILSRIRTSLRQHHKNLAEWLTNSGKNGSLYLGKDGTSDGTITKADVPILAEIEHALEHIEDGSFGQCIVCNDEVEPERLMIDFTTCVCLDHYSPGQLRELEHDLEMAAKVQRHLLPGSTPVVDGIQIAALSRPSGIVGGDYYDFFCYRDCLQGLAMGDVMGKGVPASMLMASLQTSLRILGPDYDELPLLTRRLNELFRYNLKQIRFITLFLAALDPMGRTLRYTNAGHHPPLLLNGASGSSHWLKPTGPAIGLNPEADYASEQVQLNAENLLLLYTDGLVEARNGKEEFGQQRLAAYAEEHYSYSATAFLNGLVRNVQEFADNPHDDLTVMVLKVE